MFVTTLYWVASQKNRHPHGKQKSHIHDAIWYDSYNGDSLGYTGDAHAYYNIKFELKNLLGAKYDTTTYRYFAFVESDFPEQTLPGSLGVEGETTLDGLTSTNANGWKGSCAHALGHGQEAGL